MNNLHIVNILNHAIKFILLFFILLSLHVSDVIAAGSEITVNVPKPVAGTYLSQIIVSVTVNSDEDIQFRIVNPDYPGTSELLLPYTGVTADSFHIYPNADVVAVSEKATGSPKVFRYEINISPNSNADTLCGDRRASGDNWVIEAIVKPGGSGVVDITSACVNSYDRSSGCTSGNIFINSSDPASVAHILTGGSPESELCRANRPPVDAVLVLDKSGSMNGIVQTGDSKSKITRLAEAVTDFSQVWKIFRDDLKPGDTAPGVPYMNPDDRIGLIFFDSNASWANGTALNPPTMEWSSFNGLENVEDTPVPGKDVLQLVKDNITKVPAGGMTSIGDGLEKAASVLTNVDGTRKQVILLMSDGRQNNTRMVGIVPEGEADGGKVRTYNRSGSPDYQILANQDNFDIYSVTVGTSTSVSPVINQQVAEKTGGFYLNSEDDAAQLRPFFLELLQNFIKFNTYDVVHVARSEVSARSSNIHKFKLTTSTRSININVMPLENSEYLYVTVIPPGFTEGFTLRGQDTYRFNYTLPMEDEQVYGNEYGNKYDYNGEWQVKVTPFYRDEDPVPIKYDVFVLADDSGVKTDFSASFKQKNSDLVLLTVKAREFGKGLAGIDNQISVTVGKPGVSPGEIIAQSQLAPSQSTIDPQSSVQSILDAVLVKNPGALKRATDVVQLVDNGNAAQGDLIAGDGIYSMYYSPTEIGHYNFLFNLDAETNQSGVLQRMVIKTLYVRPVPDPVNTVVTTDRSKESLSVRVIPKTKYDSRMPGYGSYFWLTLPGNPPVKMRDNFDGSYFGVVPVSGSTVPKVSLNFLDVAQVLSEDITPDKLPVELGSGTVIINDVQNPVQDTNVSCGCFDIFCLISKIFN